MERRELASIVTDGRFGARPLTDPDQGRNPDGRMLIDIHVHTTRIAGKGLERPNGTRYPDPDELLRMMDAANIDMAVVMSTVNPECRYCFVIPEEVLEICNRFPDRFIPFASLDPRMIGNSKESNFLGLLNHYKQAGCKGIGEYMPNLPFDDPLNVNLFKQVEEVGLPILFHITTRIGGAYGCFDEIGLPRLEKVLSECPNLIFLGHSQPFWAEIGTDVAEQNRRGYPSGPVKPGRVVELMRKYPNLHGDLSARSGYNAITRDRDFGHQFLEEFQDRLYFGTDIANVPQELPQVKYFREIGRQDILSKTAYEKITWRNAARLLRLQTGADGKPLS